MNRWLVIFEQGGLVDPSGGLQPGCIPALLELTRNGYSVLLAKPPASGAASNEPLFGASSTLTAETLLVSQGIVVKQAAGFTDKNPAQQAGELSKVLLGEPLSSDDSYVVGQAGEAEALAQQLGFRCFCPGVTANQGAAGSVAVDWAAFSRQLCLLPRISQVQRHSNETKIDIRLDLDSPDRHINVKTGMGFFDHMLEQVAKHGGFSMDLQCEGDLHIDEHHTVEDCALALGQALREALGDKRGIDRYGFVLPMDEAEVQVSMDLSARPYFVFNGAFTRDRVGDLSTEMVPHFFKSLSDTLGASLHITMTGDNAHHQVEAMFKGVGRTLKQAIRKEGNELPTTKGML